MESDEGTFQPSGLGFTGNAKARDIVKEIMALLQPINVTDVFDAADGTDIDYWMRDGVPGEHALQVTSLLPCSGTSDGWSGVLKIVRNAFSQGVKFTVGKCGNVKR